MARSGQSPRCSSCAAGIHLSFLVPAVPHRFFPAHTRLAVVCDHRPERDCARAWGGGHRYTGYAYRLPDWIIDTTHRVSASTTTLTHPRRHTLLHNEWLIFVGSRMHLGRAQRAYVHPVCTCADTDAGTCSQPRSWRSQAIATTFERTSLLQLSPHTRTRAHAHTHTRTLTRTRTRPCAVKFRLEVSAVQVVQRTVGFLRWLPLQRP